MTAAVCAVASLAACSASGAPSAAGYAAAVSGNRCNIAAHDFIPAARLPGYTQFVDQAARIPPVQSMRNHPLPFTRRYVCGQFRGFISDLALSGPYRQQNNERARRLGYTLGKWPLVPLTGAIVSQQKNRVLEIYEGIYEFDSPDSSAAFLIGAREAVRQGNAIAGLARRQEGHSLPVSLGPGTMVIEHPLGPQRTADELAIYVGLRLNDFAVSLSFQGGDALDWRDVTYYWNVARSQLAAISSGRPR
jgi:hypothetical protein